MEVSKIDQVVSSAKHKEGVGKVQEIRSTSRFMRSNLLRLAFSGVFLVAATLSATAFSQPVAREGTVQLVNALWQASSVAEINQAKTALKNTAANVEELYSWLRVGPTYSNSAATGQLERNRDNAAGVNFRYAVLVPNSYDSSKRYPVEFMLHGGVGRPKQDANSPLWRRGYESLERADRITVVPAAWSDAYWWQATQADNLPEILRLVKKEYNVDDNRVTMTGVSDGGTGSYFFAFKQPTEWAAFFPYIAHPGVLRNAQSGGGYRLYFENLLSTALYIVNGENDPLYPVSAVRPFIDILEQVEVDHVFVEIEDGGHNTAWLPDHAANIERYKEAHPRDPFPEKITWVADRTDRYNRNRWVRIDARAQGSRQPAKLEVERDGNHFEVSAQAIGEFTLLLNPEEVNFSQPISVKVNDSEMFNQRVEESMDVLLEHIAKDYDRDMLITAELTIAFP